MGALAIPLIGALVSPIIGRALSPQVQQPSPVVVEPPQVLPTLPKDAATNIEKSAENRENQFLDQMTAGMIDRARKQGVPEASIQAAAKELSTWKGQNASERGALLGLMSQASTAKANWQNQINQNNFNTQLQAMSHYPAVTPQSFQPSPLGGIMQGLGGMINMGGQGNTMMPPTISPQYPLLSGTPGEISADTDFTSA